MSRSSRGVRRAAAITKSRRGQRFSQRSVEGYAMPKWVVFEAECDGVVNAADHGSLGQMPRSSSLRMRSEASIRLASGWSLQNRPNVFAYGSAEL